MTRSELAEAARARFRERFGSEPRSIGLAPGRVNLIGEHVDYVGGIVLPAAVDRFTAVAVGPADDWELASDVPGGDAYVHALAGELASGPLRVAVASSVPAGAGLSSSAALLVALAAALAPGLAAADAALACRRAEHRASGVRVGIMDQFAAAAGRAGHALLLDCRTLEHVPVRLPAGVRIAVIDSGTRRALADTPYEVRRAEAEAAVAGAGGHARRLRHILSEIQRVGECAAALSAGRLDLAGRLLNESHASLRDDFEVSTPELDALQAQAARAAGCHGCRLMGAGFGGSLVALVDAPAAAAFAADLGPPVHLLDAVDGAFAG